MKKQAAMKLTLVGMLAFSLLTGCSGAKTDQSAAPSTSAQNDSGQQSADSSKPVTIKWWTGWATDAGPGDIIKKFNEKYPNIKVENVQFRNNDEGNVKVDTSLLAGQDIDIFFNFGVERLDPRAKKNLLLDLTPYIQKDHFDVEGELGTGIYQYNGKYYGLPATSNAYGIWINKSMLDAANLKTPTSWTLDEYADFARKLTKGSGETKVYGTSDSQAANAWANLADGSFPKDPWYNKDGLSNWDAPAYKQLLEFKNNAENVEKFQFPYKEYMATKVTLGDNFLKGKIAMGLYGNSLARNIADTKKYPRDFKVELAPLPTLAAGQTNYLAGVNYFGYLAINAKSEYKDAAWTFMKWLCTDGSSGFAKVGHIPTWKKTDKGALVKEIFGDNADQIVNVDEFEKVMLNYDAPKQQMTNFTAIAQLKSIMQTEMEKVLYGSSSVDDAIAKMKKDSDEAINKAK